MSVIRGKISVLIRQLAPQWEDNGRDGRLACFFFFFFRQADEGVIGGVCVMNKVLFWGAEPREKIREKEFASQCSQSAARSSAFQRNDILLPPACFGGGGGAGLQGCRRGVMRWGNGWKSSMHERMRVHLILISQRNIRAYQLEHGQRKSLTWKHLHTCETLNTYTCICTHIHTHTQMRFQTTVIRLDACAFPRFKQYLQLVSKTFDVVREERHTLSIS